MPGWAHWGEDVNEDSLVLLVEYGDFQALFAGDAGFPGGGGDGGTAPARWICSRWAITGAVAAPATSGSMRCAPKVAVISVGRNDYGHPRPPRSPGCAAIGSTVHRTDRRGDGHVTDGRTRA